MFNECNVFVYDDPLGKDYRMLHCTAEGVYASYKRHDIKSGAIEEARLLIQGVQVPSFKVPSSDLEGCLYHISGHELARKDTTAFLEGVIKSQALKGENSGEQCSYYEAEILHPQNERQASVPYTANCEDIIQALGMTFDEGCEFKSLWRRANARLGRVKAETTAVRDATKAVHYAKRVLAFELRKQGAADASVHKQQ